MNRTYRNSLRRFPLPTTLPYTAIDIVTQVSPVSLFEPSAVTTLIDELDTRVAVAIDVPAELGARVIPNRTSFEQLARFDNVPGALAVREVKFLMTHVDSDTPILYFINTRNVGYHYIFAKTALGVQLTGTAFNQQTYFTDSRKFLAGTILLHDSFSWPSGDQGLYVFEFWPTDPVKVRFVSKAYRLLRAAMPFVDEKLAYHPAGETHQTLYQREKAQYEQAGVKQVSTKALFGNRTYSPLNLGEGFGRLRLIDAVDPRPPTIHDIVVFKLLPNDLTHVAGVLTEEPQTPLSHINLKAKQNDTPNAYLKGASNDPRISPLINKLVYLKVAADDIEIREATQAEFDEHLERIRPQEPQLPRRDLSRMKIVDLKDIGNADLIAYGAKAANVAELTKNIFDPNWEGYYINVQVGEALVTNPEDGSVPDELLVMRTIVSENPTQLGSETIYIRHSNLVQPPNHVLSDDQKNHWPKPA
ncbi:MAG: hypothetical protein KZQ88_16020 [Candidatus Thiodiazotropha sp. (ex Dulcina madagascariensis)]|nr:hypothetical protein [Candidatus Thiodiazotropha sp. (ex Dulcina madagascariensis)]MCU7925408.1 hypothetical protein [Candidatus Thiodiazotropha sp. (ex Dulcina madagascariensis)]